MSEAFDGTPEDVLAFWREAGPRRWYEKDAGFDGLIRIRFFKLWEKAAKGELSS